MKADLIYIEAEHDEVPGIVRELAADEITASKVTAELLKTGGLVYRHNMSVEIPLAYSHLEMEAALCVWEHLCEITVATDKPDKVWMEYRQGVGSVELRHYSIDIGIWVLKVYDLLPEWFRAIGSYDWEIIPAIVSEITPGEAFKEPKQARDAILNSDWAKGEYRLQFDWRLKYQYGLDLEGAGLSKEEFLEQWFNPEVDPEDQARVYAEKYDLEKVR
ncbi:MAG: hypothetical protein E5V72_25250 [Mesorhizobium sp.]|uniref:hypothetical protein n=1 Tax=Mesorhizobium sp. TaxID=1871066 RepID=UPI000FE81727|nr:hypothetical protein [Mesorhizobium sp.]RWH50255.1 MAG: hypothetical protein EOQ80_04600 [Mesorhizobium sp.]RWH52279.1 MAG: hypothetical protein EOQ82_26645 [Mesorhizobium sp.]RWI69688.1 MAG: hypothetical protein EOR18_20890 [Mesorhizobium sp.]RWI76155.1 MAG: hypothetical protein EOR19_18480 [Mesorhizobium sp.]RWJ33225.1 MAG: hypothetical protein EOR28_11610 [Mesorhizobium sp.]